MSRPTLQTKMRLIEQTIEIHTIQSGSISGWIVSLLFFVYLTINGCSVGMALSGKQDPNLGAVRVGSTRGEIELHLGNPISTMSLPGGERVDVYEYEVGNEPSGGRAIGHAAMDVVTLGAWELIGTPIEGFTGDKRRISITYDKNDVVKKLAGTPPKRQL